MKARIGGQSEIIDLNIGDILLTKNTDMFYFVYNLTSRTAKLVMCNGKACIADEWNIGGLPVECTKVVSFKNIIKQGETDITDKIKEIIQQKELPQNFNNIIKVEDIIDPNETNDIDFEKLLLQFGQMRTMLLHYDTLFNGFITKDQSNKEFDSTNSIAVLSNLADKYGIQFDAVSPINTVWGDVEPSVKPVSKATRPSKKIRPTVSESNKDFKSNRAYLGNTESEEN